MAELGEFVEHHEELKALGVQVLGVSVDSPEISRASQARLKARFPLLSDADDRVMDLYGTRYGQVGPGGQAINTPTLILIDKQGTIRWIHQAKDFRMRAPIREVIAEAKKLQ